MTSDCELLTFNVLDRTANTIMETNGELRKRSTSRSVSILGTGDFGCALAKRFLYSGYDVTIGSRYPDRRFLSARDECLASVHLCSLEEAIAKSGVVIVAIHADHFRDTLTPYSGLLAGKIVVDVSNRKKRGSKTNAQLLADLLPQSRVVKAFNVVSAYSLESSTAGESRRIFVAGEDVEARERVSALVRDMGFSPVDMGGLKAAKDIEDFVLTLFPLWIFPLVVTAIIFLAFTLWLSVAYFYQYPGVLNVDQIFLRMLNRPMAVTAIIVLALAYLPGCIAAFVQLFRGSKHQRFPMWLDHWLRTRKQLGLISMILAVVHTIMSLLIITPGYYPSWFYVRNMTAPYGSRLLMTWHAESSMLAGVLCVVLLLVLGCTSDTSVGDTLNWREWRFVQSYMGYVTLALAVLHVVLLGIRYWVGYPASSLFRDMLFLSILIPCLVLAMKCLLILPCLDRPLTRIRRGWERGQPKDLLNTSALSP